MKRLIILMCTVSTLMVAQDAAGSYKLTGVDVLYTFIARGDYTLTVTDAYGMGVQVPIATIPGGAPFTTQAMQLPDAALAAIDSGIIDVLQIPFSILDQRMATQVLPAARAAYVGIVGRSVLLKGALTPKARHLPEDLIGLREAADQVRRVLDVSWEELPQVAIRYCLGTIGLDTILLGVRTQSELDGVLAAAKAGPLPESDMASAQSMGLDDDRLLNPVYWEIP